MGSISAYRGQGPVAAMPVPPVPDTAPRRSPAPDAAPVTAPQRQAALSHPAASQALVTARLAERDETDHPATEARIAAEAAREAYIRASLAAGISPLPLPGA
jgi:hypothetical protein